MGRVPSTFSVAVQMRLQSVQPSSAWLCWCSINSANSSEVLVAQSCPTLCDPMACSPQTALSMAFSRQENWSGLPCPPPGDLPDPGIQPGSPALQADSLPSEWPRKPQIRPGLWACFYGKAKHQQSASPLQRSACSGRHYRRGGFSLPLLSSRLGVLPAVGPAGHRWLCGWSLPGTPGPTSDTCHCFSKGAAERPRAARTSFYSALPFFSASLNLRPQRDA